MRRSAEDRELKLLRAKPGDMPSRRVGPDVVAFSEIELTAESLGLSLTTSLDGRSSRVALGSGRGLSRSLVLTVAS
jgi:hypothetical protein